MAISIDYPTKVITVNQADCTFVSGTFYRLPTKTVFKAEVDALLDNEPGMIFPHPIDHNTEYTVAGVTYSPKVEVVNGYSVQFLPDTLWSVELTESNNNIWDVGNGILVQNSVQVIPTNTAGLQIVATGSGVTAQDKIDIANQNWAQVLEGAMSAEGMMRIMMSALSAASQNHEMGLPEYMNMAGDKPRISAVTDEFGNRTSRVLDET